MLGFQKVRPQDRVDNEVGLPFALHDYLELVDWTGRAVLENKRGYIPGSVLPVLQQVGINPDEWLPSIMNYKDRFTNTIGPAEALRSVCERLGKRWLRGQQNCRLLYQY